MTDLTKIATLITLVFGLMLTDLFSGVHRLLRNRPVCAQTSAFLGTDPNLLNRAHSRSGVPT